MTTRLTKRQREREQARIEFMEIHARMLDIHQRTEHDPHKIIYGLHGGGTLEYYNYFGTRVSTQYRHYLYNSNTDSTEYIIVGYIGKHDLFT